MQPTDLTVSAVIERDGKFLIVEERASGVVVINLPGGHIEAGETPEQAVVRETLEETGCTVSVSELLGVYLWIHPQSRQQFLRVIYTAETHDADAKKSLDPGIQAVHWYSVADLEHRSKDLRSPVVRRSVDDYLAGVRQPQSLLRDMGPLQDNIAGIMASASLV